MKLRLLRNLRSQQHCPLAASIARAAQHAVKRGLVSAGSGRGLLADTAPAFVFDIDGVLMRGSSVLTEARRALARLYSESGPRVPLAFLTNGGGMLESRRAKVLSQALGVPVSENQVKLLIAGLK